jgi:hypothetical protein
MEVGLRTGVRGNAECAEGIAGAEGAALSVAERRKKVIGVPRIVGYDSDARLAKLSSE